MSHMEFAGGWLPLTMGQLDFWEEFIAHPDQPVSTVAHYLDIEGDVDEDALMRAISQTTREAEVLSARFRQEAGGESPLQRFDPHHASKAEYVDLRDLADPVAEAKRRMEADLGARLDLKVDRLSAQSLFRIGDKRYLWYIRAHHIIVDGYGLALIEQRCGQLYSHFLGSSEAGHPFHRFAEFIDEENAYRKGHRWEADRAFWSDYLDLPVDLPVLERAAEDYGEPGYHHCEMLSDAFCRKLQETASSIGIGWPDLLVFLSGTYLYHTMSRQRAGNQGLLTLWLPFMSRWGSVGAHLPAMLVNILPFHFSLEARETLGTSLVRNTGLLRKHRRHGRYRIEEISADRGLAKESRFFFSPLINVLPFDAPHFKGSRVSRHILASGPGDGFNLTFRAQENGSRLTFCIDTDPEITDGDAFEQHKRNLPAFLEHCLSAAAMECGIADLWSGFISASRT